MLFVCRDHGSQCTEHNTTVPLDIYTIYSTLILHNQLLNSTSSPTLFTYKPVNRTSDYHKNAMTTNSSIFWKTSIRISFFCISRVFQILLPASSTRFKSLKSSEKIQHIDFELIILFLAGRHLERLQVNENSNKNQTQLI